MWSSGNLLPPAPPPDGSQTISSSVLYGILPRSIISEICLLPNFHKNQFKICLTSFLESQLRHICLSFCFCIWRFSHTLRMTWAWKVELKMTEWYLSTVTSGRKCKESYKKNVSISYPSRSCCHFPFHSSHFLPVLCHFLWFFLAMGPCFHLSYKYKFNLIAGGEILRSR